MRPLRRLFRGTGTWTQGRDTGAIGESLAVDHLRHQGWRILDRNLRVGRGEIDILAQSPDRQWVAIVEVKTRHGAGVDPAYRVTHHKKRMLEKAAATLMSRGRGRGLKWRLDVITVDLVGPADPVITWYRNAVEGF